MLDLKRIEAHCKSFILEDLNQADAAHDLDHIVRVVENAKALTSGVVDLKLEVLVPAAWLHDCVSLPKNSKNRSLSSKMAAEKAVKFLQGLEYPKDLLAEVFHAIEAHSFSAGIKPESIEAKLLQDADRLDALGAIGIVRTIAVGANLGKSLYEPNDPLAENRPADDSLYTIDHFYTKLFKLPSSMNTEAGRIEADRRLVIMQDFLSALKMEVLRTCDY